MSKSEMHICQCSHCQQESVHAEKELHQQMNLFLSRLDEQPRRWYGAMEANRIGAGGVRLLSQITGLDEKTIRRGQQELADAFAERSIGRMRLPGGGRLKVEKKIQSWN